MNPNYTTKSFTTPEELDRAAAFDTAVFSQDRVFEDGTTVAQPIITSDYFRKVVRDGGHVVGFVGDNAEAIMALAVIVTARDAQAPEPILRNLGPKDSYFQGLAVHEDYRGLGLSRPLVDEGLRLAREDGKERMFTTIHRNNFFSLRRFLNANFLGVALQDIYYPLPGRDGERLIMLNGDLNNSQRWVQKAIGGPVCRQLISESSPAESDATVPPGFATLASLLELGFCVSNVERKAENSLMFSTASFTGDLSVVPHLLYPYSSLTEGLQAQFKDPQNPSIEEFVSVIVLKHLDANGSGELVASRIKSDYFQPQAAQMKWLFIDWLRNYQNSIREKSEFTASPLEGKLDGQEFLDRLKAEFLYQENNALWAWIRQLPMGHSLRSNVEAIAQKPSMAKLHTVGDSDLITLLGDQNTTLYGILSESSLMRLARDADSRSRPRRLARFLIGRS